MYSLIIYLLKDDLVLSSLGLLQIELAAINMYVKVFV